jgi:hypothetical protein
MNERFAERIRERRRRSRCCARFTQQSIPTQRKIAEFFELHAAHERKHGRTENAERAAQRTARLRKNPSPNPG